MKLAGTSLQKVLGEESELRMVLRVDGAIFALKPPCGGLQNNVTQRTLKGEVQMIMVVCVKWFLSMSHVSHYIKYLISTIRQSPVSSPLVQSIQILL